MIRALTKKKIRRTVVGFFLIATVTVAVFVPFPILFRLLVRLGGYDGMLKAGTYTVSPETTIGEFVSDVASGRSLSDDILVGIPEGSTTTEVLDTLADAGVIAASLPDGVRVMGDEYAD